MFNNSPSIDLEAPYADACAREERYKQIENQARADIWAEFTDELEVEKFIDGYEPQNLLRDIVQEVAQTHEKIEKAKGNFSLTERRKSPEEIARECLRLKQAAYQAVFLRIEQEIDLMAERRAQRIYDAQ